jgi:hypothetical protein
MWEATTMKPRLLPTLSPFAIAQCVVDLRVPMPHIVFIVPVRIHFNSEQDQEIHESL